MLREIVLVAATLASPLILPGSAAGRTPATGDTEVPLAMDFLSALGRLDFDAAARSLDEHAILELPYVNDGLTIRGRGAILQFFRSSMSKSVSGIAYKLDQAYIGPDRSSIALEISTQGRTSGGQDYSNRLVGVFQFQGGKIVRFREYFNASKLNSARKEPELGAANPTTGR